MTRKGDEAVFVPSEASETILANLTEEELVRRLAGSGFPKLIFGALLVAGGLALGIAGSLGFLGP